MTVTSLLRWFLGIHPTTTEAGTGSSALAAAPSEAPGDPAAYEILHNEAVRGLTAQSASVDELRARAGMMLSATGVVSAFLGTAVVTIYAADVSRGAAIGDPKIIVAAALMVVSSVIFVLMLWPRSWSFRISSSKIIEHYIEGERPASVPEIHRSLAWYYEKAELRNAGRLKWLLRLFSLGCVLFIAEVAVWIWVLYERVMP